MSLRRLSTMIDPERFRNPPRSASKKAPVKTLVALSREFKTIPQPVRTMTKTPNTGSASVKNIKVFTYESHDTAVPGPSRQLIAPSPLSTTYLADGLDGIAALPGTSCVKVLRSAAKEKKSAATTSGFKSGIPRNSALKSHHGSGLGVSSNRIKRASLVSARKRLSMSKPARATAAPAHCQNPRIAALAKNSTPQSSDSTTQFEADELAAAASATPFRSQRSTNSCPSNCTQVLNKIMNILGNQNEIVTQQNKLMQALMENIDKNNKLMQAQLEFFTKWSALPPKKIEYFNHSVPGKETDGTVLSSEEERENDPERSRGKRRKKVNTVRVAKQYNAIRSGFKSLSLRTPAKNVEGACAETPKTPKSILSRTLHDQLSNLYEES